MGSSYSTPDEKTNTTDKVENVKRLFNVDNNDDFLETLNMSDFKLNDNKLPLPIIGGKNNYQEDEEQHVDFDLVGGGQQNDIRFMSKKRRYLRHNIFKILSQLDNVNKSQKGGNPDEDEKYLSTSSDDEAIKHIKNIILREVNKLNSDSNGQLGGDCGCDGNKGAPVENEDEQHGGAKKKSKKVVKKSKSSKSKKLRKQKGGDRRKKRDNDTKKNDSSNSSSSSSSSSSEDTDTEESYNSKNKSSLNQSESSLVVKNKDSTDVTESDESEDVSNSTDKSDSSVKETETETETGSEGSQKGGLSIFPFNSSEIKSTVSEKKNMRMIRRKI